MFSIFSESILIRFACLVIELDEKPLERIMPRNDAMEDDYSACNNIFFFLPHLSRFFQVKRDEKMDFGYGKDNDDRYVREK